MRVHSIGMGLSGLLLVACTAGAPVVRGANTSCDRACLKGFVNQYIDALVARDPSRLPLTKTAKYTEDGNTPFDEPFSFSIGEVFKIKDGKIFQIEALVLNVPYGMKTGW